MSVPYGYILLRMCYSYRASLVFRTSPFLDASFLQALDRERCGAKLCASFDDSAVWAERALGGRKRGARGQAFFRSKTRRNPIRGLRV